MSDGTFDNLTLNGARANLIGQDGAGNFWVRVGTGPEPGSAARGFHLATKSVIVNEGWSLNGPTIAAIFQDLTFPARDIAAVPSVSTEARAKLQSIAERSDAFAKAAHKNSFRDR
jgi:hypothetical protein